MTTAAVEGFEVESAVESALESCERAVLAVSGGLDSMVLLTVASRLPVRTRRKIMVATFDHGTGRAAGRATALVARQALRCGFLCVSGRASTVGTREEEWRRTRWQFLEQVSSKRGGSIGWLSFRIPPTLIGSICVIAFAWTFCHASSLSILTSPPSFFRWRVMPR